MGEAMSDQERASRTLDTFPFSAANTSHLSANESTKLMRLNNEIVSAAILSYQKKPYAVSTPGFRPAAYYDTLDETLIGALDFLQEDA